MLAVDDFRHVIQHAPLISIDLIVCDDAGRYLLGMRTNAPAKGLWFVPGGRIYKDERITEAFRRISKSELGEPSEASDAEFLGVYEHFYDENALADAGFGTHYVVMAFSVGVDRLDTLPEQQHSAYRWLTPEEVLKDPCVHSYTKDYFLSPNGMR